MSDQTKISNSMKLTIFGSYNMNSVGDKAILIGLLNLLFKESNIPLYIQVLSFSDDSIKRELMNYHWGKFVNITQTVSIHKTNALKRNNYSRSLFNIQYLGSLLPKKVRSWINMINFTRKLAIQNDLTNEQNGLIIGGGNLLMDLYPNWPIRPFLISKKFKKSNLPVIIAGVGAFPINTVLGKIFLKSLVRRANLVFVRDQKTKQYIKKWGVNIKYHPDFSLSFPVPKIRVNKKEMVAVNIAPIYSTIWPYQDPQKYKTLINNIARHLYKYWMFTNRKTSFFLYDTNYPYDRLGSTDLIKRLKNYGLTNKYIKYDDRLLTCEEIIKKIISAKFAITTRLHAGLLALISELPIIAISYQPKVKNILADFGMENCVIKIEEINSLDFYLKQIELKPENFKLSSKKLSSLNRSNQKIIREILSYLSLQRK